MANWIECRSYVSPGVTVYVNLDQVVKIVGGKDGCTITYAGGDGCEFVVANTSENILATERVRSIA
jgi:hypothetical protein